MYHWFFLITCVSLVSIQARLKAFARSICEELNGQGEEKDENEELNGRGEEKDEDEDEGTAVQLN